ncbi:MAG TPA: hypothetical protein DDZ80_29645 [Cyanobacteria bacterium UBA8803]|nr:hypothetical protein [Cyanobacteria bacterium UBA9273]HBL62407.1 hypothetical protein [Cyanobacteria bacterium UBA8803]
MQSQDTFTEITFHYVNGETESFDIPITPEAFGEQLPDLLNQPWLTLHLFDQTVVVFTAQILRVEVKPPIPELQGSGVFPEVHRVTALTRGAKVWEPEG